MRRIGYIAWCLLLIMSACTRKESVASDAVSESKKAKEMLQGIWIDRETENVVFEIKGDTVFYPDSTSLPAYFKIVADTMILGPSVTKYALVKQTAHVFWFVNQAGDTIKLEKSEEALDTLQFSHKAPEAMTVTEVTKHDTVVSYDNKRYHCYVAVNPTKYKVVSSSYNEDGVEVSNVYYDNIVHVSVFNGSTRLYGKNFQKSEFVRFVPENFLSQAILVDMNYDKTDADGFHFNATLCTPHAASCYLVETVISFQGKLGMKLVEY